MGERIGVKQRNIVKQTEQQKGMIRETEEGK
jgi:hypothetical protein